MDDVRLERVLRAVECVPTGQVATYGDIGRVSSESPRVVGNLLARWGSNVPWWRICNAKGEIPGHYNDALPHWQEEKIALSPSGAVLLSQHRIDPNQLEKIWYKAIADLA